MHVCNAPVNRLAAAWHKRTNAKFLQENDRACWGIGSHLQLRPVLLHTLHLLRLQLRLCCLPVTHCCHLCVQGALHLASTLLLPTNII
jgi:hypothetical protein